jgi:adenylate cyclase
MLLQRRTPSSKNPRFCSRCDVFLRKFPGGAEVETSIMFVDVRGPRAGCAHESGRVQRGHAPLLCGDLPALNACDGFILDVRGDGLLALFPPGFSGPDHAAKALRAARTRWRRCNSRRSDGTPLPVQRRPAHRRGLRGHDDWAEAGVEDVTVLGDAANVAARLCAAAPPGQAWVSEATAWPPAPAPGLDAPCAWTSAGAGKP